MDSISAYKGTQLKILELLGSGLSPEIVATAAGVSPSYVSQLLSEEQFATEVTALRFKNLQAATARDHTYDSIEDRLLEKMANCLEYMYKPHEILKAITVINGAKRRGAAAPEQMTINNTVISLSMPAPIINRFTRNTNNQVIEAAVEVDSSAPSATQNQVPKIEKQSLVTMPSARLLKLANGQSNGSQNSGRVSRPAILQKDPGAETARS
jgi:transcriptional regulator with XRE-family HTH domain